jgi:hypothetical protein
MGCVKQYFKELFCKHNYEKIDYYAAVDNERNVRFPMRRYRCNKCGKDIWVDGRYDPYFK